jgi:hypothetical protein
VGATERDEIAAGWLEIAADPARFFLTICAPGPDLPGRVL